VKRFGRISRYLVWPSQAVGYKIRAAQWRSAIEYPEKSSQRMGPKTENGVMVDLSAWT
jgi:uncharacterized protein (DUF885 family)